MAIDWYTTTTYNPPKNTAIDKLIAQFAQAESRLRETIEPIYAETIKRYGPGGTFLTGALGRLERQKMRDIGRAMQTDISRGLFGVRDYGAAWEEAVGAGARAKLEDIAMQRLTQAQAGYAGYLERSLPDLGLLAQLASTAASAPAGYSVTSYATTRAPGTGGMPSQLVSFTGRRPVSTTPTERKPTPEYTPPDIKMGTPYGPMFQSQEELAKIAGVSAPTAATAPAAAPVGEKADWIKAAPKTLAESVSFSKYKKSHGIEGHSGPEVRAAMIAWRNQYQKPQLKPLSAAQKRIYEYRRSQAAKQPTLSAAQKRIYEYRRSLAR